MNKKITLLKPLTAAILLAAFLMALQSCRKSEKISLSVPEVPEVPLTVATSVVPTGPLFVSTAAGDGTPGVFNLPAGVATDASGNVYVADMANNRIRKITAAGVVSTLAGTANIGSQDGAGATATFNMPSSVATDAAGNVYVADRSNHLIRKITPDGTVSTFAGGAGMPGNAEGPGSAARFNYPTGVAVDGSGNILVADSENQKIRRITPDGVVSTFAGNGTKGTGNGPGVFSQFNRPVGVTVDVSGNVFVADAGNHKIRKIAGGLVSTLAGGGAGDESGFVNETGVNARFNNPSGVVADGAGNVYVADAYNNAIRQVTPAGVVTTISGNGVTGLVNGEVAVARFSSPMGIAINASGKLFIADQVNQRIRRIGIRTITVTTLAGDGIAGRVNAIGTAARFYYPVGLFADANSLLVTEFGNSDIRSISFSTSQVSTVLGYPGVAGYQNGPYPGALFNGPSGVVWIPSISSLFVADKYNNSIRKWSGTSVLGYAGSTASGFLDGQNSNARFAYPAGITADAATNLYVTDFFNNSIRKISPSGFVSTLAGNSSSGTADGQGSAARFNGPHSVAVDATGNVYVGEIYNNKIRKISPSGLVSTLAGSSATGLVDGTGTAAQFNMPMGLAVDASGYVYVADANNNAIRMITPSGVVSTLAGNGTAGYQDGDGSVAMFNGPVGIAVDPSGNIYVSDYANHRIRKITIQ